MAARAPSDDQDRRDIRATLQGDEEAFARLVRRYEPDVARRMWRFTRDPRDHEILVHDVFVEAYFSLSRYAFRAPFAHWLARVATHVGYGFWRDRSKARKTIALEDPNQLQARPKETRDARADTLFALLETLRPADRLVLTLAYLEDLNAKEIAARMGWTHVMTRARLSRARKRLRKLAEARTENLS